MTRIRVDALAVKPSTSLLPYASNQWKPVGEAIAELNNLMPGYNLKGSDKNQSLRVSPKNITGPVMSGMPATTARGVPGLTSAKNGEGLFRSPGDAFVKGRVFGGTLRQQLSCVAAGQQAKVTGTTFGKRLDQLMYMIQLETRGGDLSTLAFGNIESQPEVIAIVGNTVEIRRLTPAKAGK